MKCWGEHCWRRYYSWASGTVEYKCRHCDATETRRVFSPNELLDSEGETDTIIREHDHFMVGFAKMLKRVIALEERKK